MKVHPAAGAPSGRAARVETTRGHEVVAREQRHHGRAPTDCMISLVRLTRAPVELLSAQTARAGRSI